MINVSSSLENFFLRSTKPKTTYPGSGNRSLTEIQPYGITSKPSSSNLLIIQLSSAYLSVFPSNFC